jgi:hypothetical protein
VIRSLVHALSGALSGSNLRSEREKCGLFPSTRKEDSTTIGLLISTLQQRMHVKAMEQTGWGLALDVMVVSYFTETRERSPFLLACPRAAGVAADISMN